MPRRDPPVPADSSACDGLLDALAVFGEWTDQDRRLLRGALIFLVIAGTLFSGLTTVLGAMACTAAACVILFPLAAVTVALLGVAIHILSGAGDMGPGAHHHQERT